MSDRRKTRPHQDRRRPGFHALSLLLGIAVGMVISAAIAAGVVL